MHGIKNADFPIEEIRVSRSPYSQNELCQPWTLFYFTAQTHQFKSSTSQVTFVLIPKNEWLLPHTPSTLFAIEITIFTQLMNVSMLLSLETPWHDICVNKQPNYQQTGSEVDSSIKKFRRENPAKVCAGIYNINDCSVPAKGIIKPEDNVKPKLDLFSVCFSLFSGC